MDIGTAVGYWLMSLAGLGTLALGLSARQWKQRLRTDGVRADAVRTGREASGEGGTFCEVRFTTLDGDAITVVVPSGHEDGYVIYDPERPKPRLRSAYLIGPMTPTYLDSWQARLSEWTLTILGLALAVLGLAGVVNEIT